MDCVQHLGPRAPPSPCEGDTDGVSVPISLGIPSVKEQPPVLAPRHKTRKISFQIVFWITVVVNCAALFWLVPQIGTAS